MGSPATAYLDALWDQSMTLGVWQPTTQVSVGDVVIRSKDGTLSREGHLSDLTSEALPPVLTRRGSDQISFARGASVDTSAAATAPGAQLKVSFAKRSSFIVRATGQNIAEYAALNVLRKLLNSLLATAKWNTNWQLVTLVNTYDEFTLAIADGSHQEATFAIDPTKVTGPLTLPTGVSLIRANGHIKSASSDLMT